MSARTAAARMTDDPTLAARIEALLLQVNLSDAEAEEVLHRIDLFREAAGHPIEGADLLRAVNVARLEVARQREERAWASPRVEVLTTAALLELKLADVAWRIESLLPDASLGILSGWSGCWKTWLAHHVAVALACGGMFLEAYRCERGRVLIVQGEENLAEHRRKFTWTLAGAGLPDAEQRALEIHHLVAPVILSDKGGLADLVRLVGELRPDVILVDSLRQTFQGDENESSFAQAVRGAFSEIQAAHRCSVLLIHHTRKVAREAQLNEPGQRLRGSGALRAMLDQHWAIERDPAGFGTLMHEKSRQGREVAPFNFRFAAEEGRARFVNLGPAADPDAASGCTREIITLLRAAPAQTRHRAELIVQLAGQFSEDQVHRALTRLVQRGRVRKGLRDGSGTPIILLDDDEVVQ